MCETASLTFFSGTYEGDFPFHENLFACGILEEEEEEEVEEKKKDSDAAVQSSSSSSSREVFL